MHLIIIIEKDKFLISLKEFLCSVLFFELNFDCFINSLPQYLAQFLSDKAYFETNISALLVLIFVPTTLQHYLQFYLNGYQLILQKYDKYQLLPIFLYKIMHLL